MAIPHYAYLMIKLPGPKGVITVHGDFDRSNNCDREFNKISEFFGVEEHFQAIAADNNKTIFPPRKKPAKDAAFNTNVDTKTHQVHPTDSNKTVKVSSSLTIALESALVEFLRENWKIFAWQPLTCQEYPEISQSTP